MLVGVGSGTLSPPTPHGLRSGGVSPSGSGRPEGGIRVVVDTPRPDQGVKTTVVDATTGRTLAAIPNAPREPAPGAGSARPLLDLHV